MISWDTPFAIPPNQPSEVFTRRMATTLSTVHSPGDIAIPLIVMMQPGASVDADTEDENHGSATPDSDTSQLPRPLQLTSDFSPTAESEDSQSQSQSIILDPSSTVQPSSSSLIAPCSQPPDPESTSAFFLTPIDSSYSVSASLDLTTDSDLALAAMDDSEIPEATMRRRVHKLARVEPSQGPPCL